MSEARIADLEMRLSFQDNAIQTMSDEMARQQQQLELLTLEVKRLNKALESASSGPSSNQADEPPPPHY